jgi:hypothetical protein
MTNPFGYIRLWFYPNLLLIFSACLLVACAIHQKKNAPDPRYNELQATLAKREASLKEMENKLAKIKLRLLEKDAQVLKLEERLNSQQVMFDEAILEVVRAKAKLRSLESKAEAASEMAEAEIAVKALQIQLKSREPDPDVIKAQQLLKMSAREFKKENYGGALYLTSQAKGHIRANQMRIGGLEKIEPVKGEILFTQPVPLKVLTTSNLRRGPGLQSKILTKLDKGTTLIGYSYKGEWVRVTSEDGTSGWIYQTLVGGR